MIKKLGFSLVELMVVIAVMGLLAGGAVVFINRFNAQQRFTSSVEKTITQLKLARNYAVTLQRPDNSKLTAVVVTIDAGGTMTAVPYPESEDDDYKQFKYFSTKVVEEGITVSSVPVTIRFAPVTGKLLDSTYKLDDAPGDIKISFSSVEGATSKEKIKIDKSGVISEM